MIILQSIWSKIYYVLGIATSSVLIRQVRHGPLASRKADSNKIDKKANMCLTFEGLRG